MRKLSDVSWTLIGSTDAYADLKRDVAHVCRDVAKAACIDELCIHDIVMTFKKHGYEVVPAADIPRTWKWGLIKVGEDDEGDDVTEVVSLYSNDVGEFTSFGWRAPCTLEEMRRATAQIENDGVNTYFYNNGTFEAEFCKERGSYLRYTPNP